MEEMTKHGRVGLAAMRAGVDRKTARKYMSGGKLPSELVEPRDWQTREDPFVEHWPEVEALLSESPGLEAKTLFELLVGKYEGRYDEGQLRTLQRRVKTWRAERGPEKDVVLGQQHRPGEAAQTDFTWTRELAVTIAGQVFAHMLCVVVPPYSNWHGGVGERLHVGVDRCASSRHPGCALSARTRARVASDGQLHRGNAPDPGRQERRRRRKHQASVQGRLSRDHATLRHEAAHDDRRREGAKRRR